MHWKKHILSLMLCLCLFRIQNHLVAYHTLKRWKWNMLFKWHEMFHAMLGALRNVGGEAHRIQNVSSHLNGAHNWDVDSVMLGIAMEDRRHKQKSGCLLGVGHHILAHEPAGGALWSFTADPTLQSESDWTDSELESVLVSVSGPCSSTKYPSSSTANVPALSKNASSMMYGWGSTLESFVGRAARRSLI